MIGWGIKKVPTLPLVVKTWGATLGGLAAIPFIIHPIDHAVDYVLDSSLRTLYSTHHDKEVGATVVGHMDLTGDGKAETTAYDTVGDGKADSLDTVRKSTRNLPQLLISGLTSERLPVFSDGRRADRHEAPKSVREAVSGMEDL